MKLYIALLCLLQAVLLIQCVEPRYKSVYQLPANVNRLKLKGLVTSVYDGDTFKFYHIPAGSPDNTRPNFRETLPVRLIGIDTPEMPRGTAPGQPLAQEARDKLRSLILRKRVELDIYAKDPYNRILGSITVDGKPVSLTMVEAGLANVYRGGGAQYGSIKQDLIRAETQAKRSKIGIWGLTNRQSPSAYKRQHSTDSQGSQG